jgi:hypothetical protein
MLILALTFGSLVATGMPIITAVLGPVGGDGHRPPVGVRTGRAGAPRSPDRPDALAAPGPGGHRCHARGHHRAPGLRPHGRGVWARVQRPVADRDQAEPAGASQPGIRDKYNQAKANQADLERKQKKLTAESNSLKAQQASLERQQAQLQDQKRRLQQRRLQIRQQAVAVWAAIRANLRVQAALAARTGRDSAWVRVLTRAVARACGPAPQSPACQRARRALATAQADLAATQQALVAKRAQL